MLCSRLFAVAAVVCLPFAAKADTVLNLNATTGNASTNFSASGANNLAPSFFQTVSLAAGTYTITAIGTGITSGGTTSVYSGFSFNTPPGANSYREETGIDIGGTFSNASAANGYQNSYTKGSFDTAIFTGTFGSNAAALAGNSPYVFTLANASNVTFYAFDDSFLPNNTFTGYDDNSGGVSLRLSTVTPEPSSLIMLGTGVLSAAGMIRRKLIARR